MPLLERRNSGLDQVRHSGESMWYRVDLSWEGDNRERRLVVAVTMEEMGISSGERWKRFGFTFPGKRVRMDGSE